MKIKFILSVYVISLSLFFSAKEMVSSVEQGQTWLLEANSNKLSKGDSKVLYFFSTDAYNTYQARIFSDWDRFSIIDSRNLVRLNKGDRVEIIKSKHFERIYEVKLLDGFEKNRNYFVIREDLLKDFKLMENEDA